MEVLKKSTHASMVLQCLLLLLSAIGGVQGGSPFNVSYDHRSLLFNGERQLIVAGAIHYPRSTPEVRSVFLNILLEQTSAFFCSVWHTMA
jgi:hypothetical protein